MGARRGKELTTKEARFVNLMVEHPDDPVFALKNAGYSVNTKSRNNAYIMAHQVKTRPIVAEAILERKRTLAAAHGMTSDQVIKNFMEVYQTAVECSDFANANRAMENIGKFLGMFVERKEINSKVQNIVEEEEDIDSKISKLTALLQDDRDEPNAKFDLKSLSVEGNG